MAEFIDRAQLEAQAEKLYPVPTGPRYHQIAAQVRLQNAFLAGTAAHAALLDAETTEEWGVGPSEDGEPDQFTGTEGTARMVAERDSIRLFPVVVYSRRVLRTPWLPSEGGENP